jgi:DNA-binding transcriptional ArsR family regulator
MDAFTAMADPTRRKIIDLLSETHRDAGTISAAFAISQPAVSRHLRVLREAGLVTVEPDGTRRIYRLNPEGFGELLAWATRYRSFWNDRLEALASQLEETT